MPVRGHEARGALQVARVTPVLRVREGSGHVAPHEREGDSRPIFIARHIPPIILVPTAATPVGVQLAHVDAEVVQLDAGGDDGRGRPDLVPEVAPENTPARDERAKGALRQHGWRSAGCIVQL